MDKQIIKMKRVIKFRGKRFDTGEWVFGMPTNIEGSSVILRIQVLCGIAKMQNVSTQKKI